MEWGEEVKRIAEKTGLNVTEIAKRIGVSQQYTQMVVSGKKQPSSLFKAKVWTIAGGNFSFEMLIELLDDETKEFVVDHLNKSNTIEIMKKSWDEKNWPEIIRNLATHRNWTIEQLLTDLNISNEDAKKIMEQKEAPDLITQYRLWDRVHYEKVNNKIINALPTTISSYLKELNKKNMQRLAKINQRKLSKKDVNKKET